MANPVIIPRLGWNMEEGTFLGWLQQDGAAVRPGDAIFRLESDKATEDIEALEGGILRIAPDGPKEGDRVLVGLVIGQLEGSARDNSQVQVDQPAPPSDKVRPGLARPVAEPPLTISRPNTTTKSSPRARRLATQLGVDWTKLSGSGRTGRVREQDVRLAATAASGTDAKKIPLTTVRRVGVQRLVQSRQATVPVTLTTTAVAANLLAFRQQFQTASAQAGPAPTLTDFFIKLTGLALERAPLLAARWEEDHVVAGSAIHIGLAVDTAAGLFVPVVRDVRTLTLRQVAAKSRDLIDRARQGTLTTRDLEGGVFTVTNLGMFGIDAFTPVINYPECAILGIGRVRQVPACAGGSIVIQDQVALSLTFDHRIVDGAPAARFLQDLVGMLENPAPWLMP